MAHRRHSQKILRALCAEVGPDDGIDPRTQATGRSWKQTKRKAHQLCAQVAEALHGALAALADDALRGLQVVSVELAPDTRRLLVTVAPPPGEAADPAAVLDHLVRASGRLRCEVAAAIHRKKAPVLAFRYAMPRTAPGPGATGTS